MQRAGFQPIPISMAALHRPVRRASPERRRLKRRGFWILTILGLVIGASCAVLSTLPTLANADPPPNPIWLDIGTLARPLASVDAAVYETDEVAYVYLVGGKQSDGAASANITLMELRGPGAVGLGTVRPLPASLYGHAAVVACQRLFVIGGWDGTRWHSEVWSAEIQPSNGALGEWRSEIGYPFPVAFHDVVVVNPDCSSQGNAATIIGIGGQRLTASAAEVEQALAAGQAWTAPDALAGDAFDAPYNMTNQVYVSNFQTGGASSSWRAAAALLPKPLSRHAAAVSGTTIIVTGGYDGDDVQSQVYMATMASDGLWPWSIGNLPHPVEYHQAVVFENKLWILGGRKNEQTEYADVFSYSLAMSTIPTAESWTEENSLPVSLHRMAAIPSNRVKQGIYIAGGIHDGELRDALYYAVRIDALLYLPLIRVSR